MWLMTSLKAFDMHWDGRPRSHPCSSTTSNSSRQAVISVGPWIAPTVQPKERHEWLRHCFRRQLHNSLTQSSQGCEENALILKGPGQLLPNRMGPCPGSMPLDVTVRSSAMTLHTTERLPRERPGTEAGEGRVKGLLGAAQVTAARRCSVITTNSAHIREQLGART